MQGKSKVSILMGIYNCADTLSDAIDSIISKLMRIGNLYYVMMVHKMIHIKLQRNIKKNILIKSFY